MITLPTVIVAIVGGIIPPLLWLFFWLREDSLHPEPKKVIVLSFIFGMIGVAAVLPFEQLARDFIPVTGLVLLAWAFIEEIMKYFAAYLGGLRTKADNEPIDPMIYLITTALGFAALENILFLLSPFDNLLAGVVTGNIRFIGATLLHTVASGTIGLSIALSFYGTAWKKIIYRTTGLCAAIVIHLLFNYFILGARGSDILMVFGFVWLAVILLLIFFEKVKRIRKIKESVRL
ncbi:PrsW family intramembrane metalloprotease [Candidatus Wolfebacteria bacterium]|nr:PrsW family intramembrane metalloprotease [Candidatus Wolfebacteria bacterium]